MNLLPGSKVSVGGQAMCSVLPGTGTQVESAIDLPRLGQRDQHVI